METVPDEQRKESVDEEKGRHNKVTEMGASRFNLIPDHCEGVFE